MHILLFCSSELLQLLFLNHLSSPQNDSLFRYMHTHIITVTIFKEMIINPWNGKLSSSFHELELYKGNLVYLLIFLRQTLFIYSFSLDYKAVRKIKLWLLPRFASFWKPSEGFSEGLEGQKSANNINKKITLLRIPEMTLSILRKSQECVFKISSFKNATDRFL